MSAADASKPGTPPAEAFGAAGEGKPAGEGKAAAAGAAAGAAAAGPTAAPAPTAPGGAPAGAPTTSTRVVPTGFATPVGTEAVAPPAAPQNGSPATPAKSDPPAPKAPPAVTEYTVKSGDTLEGIARAQLGDGQKWHAIVDLNPGLDPKALKVGQKIKLPAGGAPVAAESAKDAAKDAGNTYTVQKGDTLMAIARKFYNSDTDWKRILEANPSSLKGEPANLKTGMKLVIPAKR
jgi:nucleoid-associated protein YgaU